MLRMFNLMKKKQKYPTIFQASNISSFYKKTGDKTDMNNERGVFNVVKIRSILDKLIYNDIYSKLDSSMSSSNIGKLRMLSWNIGRGILKKLTQIEHVIREEKADITFLLETDEEKQKRIL